MILTHENITVDFFDKFPNDVKRVGILISGGADSALILYLLVLMADRRNQELEIYPITAFDVSTPNADSEYAAKRVIDCVQKITKTKRIQDLYICPIIQGSYNKYHYIKPTLIYLRNKFNFYEIVYGTSQGMPEDERPATAEGSISGEELIDAAKKWDDFLFPWAKVDKKFIAAQYKKFDLEELSNVTNSCVNSSETPCKSCWWCRERYWAFGSYDYGLQ